MAGLAPALMDSGDKGLADLIKNTDYASGFCRCLRHSPHAVVNLLNKDWA
jgi:hypothetical protein